MNDCKGSAHWVKTCYGVDLQEDGLVAVCTEKTAWPAGRSAKAKHSRLKYSTISSADTYFKEHIQKDAVVVGCVSASESLTCRLEAPFSSFNKARKVLPTILDIQLPFALEDCVCLFLNTGSSAGRLLPSLEKAGTRALAVAARLVDVERKINSFNKLGIDPLVIDHEGIALWTQSLRELPVSPDEGNVPRVIVCLDRTHSTVVIGHDGEFVSAHRIRTNDTVRISRLLRTQLEDPDGECTTIDGKDRKKTENGERRMERIQWVWTGPGAGDPELVRELHDRLSVDRPGPSVVHDEPETFLARALATRALLSGPLRCNLRKGPLTHPGIIQRSRRNSMKAALICLLSGLLLCGVNLTLRELAGKRKKDIAHAFSSLARDLAGYDIGGARGEHALKIVREKIDERENLLQPFPDAFGPSLTGAIAAIMETGRKHGLRYEMLSLSRKNVLLSGTSGDWNSCEKLLSYLTREGFTVTLDRKDALADERIPFTITSGAEQDE